MVNIVNGEIVFISYEDSNGEAMEIGNLSKMKKIDKEKMESDE